MMYILTQPDGARPTIVDDRNFYRPAGVKRWVDKGFLNKDLKVPLGAIGSLRTQIEADLLCRTCSCWPMPWDWAAGSMPPSATRTGGRSEVLQDLRPHAGLRRGHAALADHGFVALACAAAALFQFAQQPDRPALQGRASDQGHVAALLRHDGRCRRGGGGREIRQGRHLHERELFEEIYKDDFGHRYLSEAASTLRTSSNACATSAPTSTKRMAVSRRIAMPSMPPASGCRSTMSTRLLRRFFRTG